MLKPTIALLLTLAVSLTAASARADGARELRYGPCRALRVADASALDLQCGRELARVRLRYVAAPQPGQAGQREAVRALAELVRARELYVSLELPGQPSFDADGRLLVYLYDAAGANLNVALVSLGWATCAADVDLSRLAHNFRTAESDARLDRRALWTVWDVAAQRSGN
jgi:endonuclease YncB( thermonuclease family)